MSETDGANTASAPAASHFAASSSSWRGYLSKSSFGPNWVGFTNIETTTVSASSFALRTRLKCPSCSAPIVGTSAIFPPFERADLEKDVISAGEDIIFIDFTPTLLFFLYLLYNLQLKFCIMLYQNALFELPLVKLSLFFQLLLLKYLNIHMTFFHIFLANMTYIL